MLKNIKLNKQPNRFLKTIAICKQAAIPIATIFVLITSVNPIYAQSTDRNNPTALTKSEIAGTVDKDNQSEYFYSFVAEPGEVAIALDVAPNDKNTLNYVTVDLFDVDGNKLKSFGVGVISKSKRKVQKLQVQNQQKIIMQISRRSSKGSASYSLSVSGSVKLDK